MKTAYRFILVAVLFVLASCADTKPYYEALKNQDDNAAAERVERAKAETARWQALAALAPKLGAEGAAALGVALALGDKIGGASFLQPASPAQIAPPKDVWDRAEQGVRIFAGFVQAASPWAMAVESRKAQQSNNATSLALGLSRDSSGVAINGQTVAGLRDLGIAGATANRGATYNAGGDLVSGGTFSKIVDSYNPVNPSPIVVVCPPSFTTAGGSTSVTGITCTR